MLAVFGCVAAVSWAVVNSHAHGELFPLPPVQEHSDDAALASPEVSHPAVAPFTLTLAWTVGDQEFC
jgi:hypothetical protein